MLRFILPVAGVMALLVSSPAVRADEPGVQLELERTVSATPEEMRTSAAQANEDQRRILKAVTRLAEESRRKSSDGEPLPCATDALTATRSLLTVSESSERAMQAALGANNKQRADYEYRKVTIALRESRRLETEVERCVLGLDGQDGKTRIKVDGGVGDALADIRAFPEDVLDFGFDPADASPF